MRDRTRKTKSNRKRPSPIVLTRDELERAGAQVVAIGEALAQGVRANTAVLKLLVEARECAEAKGSK